LGILGLAVNVASADAQVVRNGSSVMGLTAEYPIPPPVPAGGCVWENAVFSNGAIFERFLGRPFYFRCMNGQWQSFYSFHEARTGLSEEPLRSSGPRPTPLR
jgi:hypothetical protein